MPAPPARDPCVTTKTPAGVIDSLRRNPHSVLHARKGPNDAENSGIRRRTGRAGGGL